MRSDRGYKLYLLLSYILIIISIFFLVVGITSPDDSAGSIMCICTAIFIPFIVLTAYLAVLYRRKYQKEEEIISFFKLYRRSTLQDAAMELHIPYNEIIKTLMKLKSEGKINGRFDLSTGEFVYGDSAGALLADEPIKCPQCGAYNTRKILMGDTIVCEFCGAPILNVKGKTCPYCGRPARYDEYSHLWVCDHCRRTFI